MGETWGRGELEIENLKLKMIYIDFDTDMLHGHYTIIKIQLFIFH